MLEDHPAEAVNCSRSNMSDKQRQPTTITNTTMAQMGSSSRGPSCTPSELKNNNKDASNGAVTKSSRTPRFGGGKRRSGSKWAGNKGDSNFNQGAGQFQTLPDGKQSSRPQNIRKSQTGRGFHEASARQPHYNNYDKVMKEDEFEAGSIFNPGSKKQNLSHLLNFQFEPRGNKNKVGHNRENYHGGRKKYSNYGMKKPTYNKEQYLQANCQFVVRKGHDYTQHLKNPDVIVPWEQIEQVRLKTTSDVPSCPICLYPPTTAKITKCGHVYCWTCMLHYLSLSDEKWRKCPICFESVRREDLKSVVSVPWKEFKTKDEIEMKLMRRERNSLFALPVTQYRKDIDSKGHPDMNDKINSYSQLILASLEQIQKYITSREQAELEAKYIELKESDDATICYVEEALNYLNERQSGIMRTLSEASDISDEYSVNTNTGVDDSHPKYEERGCWINDMNDRQDKVSDLRPRHASSSSEGLSSGELDGDGFDDQCITADDLDISGLQTVPKETDHSFGDSELSHIGSSTQIVSPSKGNETFYFYQSSDGQPIFLHALNVQMLVKEYGTFEACPSIIKGVILEKDGSNMSEELRNKLRFLKHVPVTCYFEVAELSLSNQIVSRSTRDHFAPQLEQRKRTRTQRAKAEKRREKRILVEENKLMGKYPGLPKSLRIESEFHFPVVGSSSALAVASEFHPSYESGASGDSRNSSPRFDVQDEQRNGTRDRNFNNLSTCQAASSSNGSHSEGISFAKMLRTTAVKPMKPEGSVSKSETFPGLLSLYPKPKQPKNVHSDSEPELEGYVPPPPKHSIGDALAQALEQACTLENNSAGNNVSNPENGTNGKKKGKKMKGKKILLSSGARPHL